VESDPSLAVGFLQDLVLGAEVVDDLLLLPVDQAGQDGPEKVPGLEDKVHGCSHARPANGGTLNMEFGPSIG
jgi:hypothetical protein